MTKDTIVFIGLGTHKESTEVAYELGGRESETIHFGKIPSTKQAFAKLARHFQSKYAKATLHFVYEAGLADVESIAFSPASATVAMSWYLLSSLKSSAIKYF